MGLHFDLRINGKPLATFEAIRQSGGGTDPDDINLYDVAVIGPHHAPNRPEIVGEATDVEHRYGDGAFRLVQRGLDAVFGPAAVIES